jgi:hypothetical protein
MTVPFLNSAQLDELSLQAEAALSKVVPQNVSIANFIIELIEMCEGNIRGIKRFSDLYARMMKAFQKEYLRLIRAGHKAIAARWLAWNFAIKPFLKDLQAILCGISAAYKRLRWLRDHNHKVSYQDYTRDVTDLLSYDPNDILEGQQICSVTHASPAGQHPNGTFYIGVQYHKVKLVFHARSKVFLEIPDELLDDVKGIGPLWSAMNGLYNPVGILWEAIPFSWLIDYFLSLRARLFQTMFDFNPYDRGVTVLGYGHSFTMSCVCGVGVYTHRPATHQTPRLATYDLYSRQVGLPFPEETTLFRVPGDWYKASIIGAIGIGMLPARRR